MQKKLLIIADPLHKVNISVDSSLALAQAALQATPAWRVFWCQAHHIHLFQNNFWVNHLQELTHVSSSQIQTAPVNKKKTFCRNFLAVSFVKILHLTKVIKIYAGCYLVKPRFPFSILRKHCSLITKKLYNSELTLKVLFKKKT
jgi:hypothetical protein